MKKKLGFQKSQTKPQSKLQAKTPHGSVSSESPAGGVNVNEEPRENVNGWLIQTPPGLAKIVQKEMGYAGAIQREQKTFVKLQRNHDLIFVGRAKNEEAFAKLRIPEMTLRCPAYGKFKISKRQLELLAEELKRVGPRRLVVQVTGKHFERHDLQRFLFREIESRGYEFDPDVEEEVWMFCIDENWYFGLPVTKSREAEGRDDREEERRGALPPPIAAAIAFSSHPRENEVVLDPTCGSGTLLAEFNSYVPSAKLIGCDVDAHAAAVARKNLKHAGARIESGDVRKVDLSSVKSSLAIANLPFGKQFGSKADNPTLYREVIERCYSLRDEEKTWRGIYLTSDTESFETAMKDLKHLVSETLFKVKIRGELATAYRVKAR